MNYYSIACLLQDYICDNVVFTCPLTFEFFFHSIDITPCKHKFGYKVHAACAPEALKNTKSSL